jgi:hypothetical protein
MRAFLALCTLLPAVLATVPSPAARATGTPSPGEQPAETGFLSVESDPPATILIDEAETGKVTPQIHLELKVGRHQLTLVSTRDKSRKRSIRFNIEAGKTTKLTFHLTS